MAIPATTANPPTPASQAVRFIILFSALFLPTLSLIPLGGLYLWEKGWLIWWALAALVTILLVVAIQRWALAGVAARTPTAASPDEATAEATDPTWSPAEELAWRDVKDIAARVDIDAIGDVQSSLGIGHETINAVARRLHPTKADAMWQFTLPEALAITERVSRRLGRFVVANIPFGDRLTVSQVLQIYSWRHMVGLAERAYDIWRIVRLANPATALTHEARERLSRAALQWGKEHVTRRLAETYVEEVGRAAIDLYGGRLRIATVNAASDVASPDDHAVATNATRAPCHRRWERSSRAIAAAALTQAAASSEALKADVAFMPLEAADAAALGDADVIVWVGAMGRDASDPILAALSAYEQQLRTDQSRAVPALVPLLITSSAPDESALQAWQARLEKIYGGLVTGALVVDESSYFKWENQALQGQLAELLPRARRVQLVRHIASLKQAQPWMASGRQAITAAGSLAASVVRSVRTRITGK